MAKNKFGKEVIEKIKFLRQQGYSLPEINRETGVSKTTVLRYIQGVEILPEFINTWFGKRGGSRKRKFLKESNALEEAKNIIQELTQREILLFTAALYWGEGSKKEFGLSNTDPALIKVFMEGIKKVFGLSQQDFRVSVRIYEDLDKEKCLSFWSQITGIPKEYFINVNVLTGKRKGKLQYGMCRVRISKGGDLLKRIHAINKVVHSQMSL